ncbi:metallophosphoesterase family protein [Promethearchaeum syntrophicum]|uniref:protein-serine/threonine phosphatase n=1 Tax=Promethearchaeum syntrophicum TaxID=2594042 RepID=A0A5B9DB31_9ARCH
MSENNYQKLLQKANLLESRDLLKCLQNLLECVQLLEEDPDIIKNSKREKEILKLRILRLGNKLNVDYSLDSDSKESDEVEAVKESKEAEEAEEAEEGEESKEAEGAEKAEKAEEVEIAKEPEEVETAKEPEEVEVAKDSEEVDAAKKDVETVEKSEIVDLIYSKLKKKISISYNEYLSFYKYVNKSNSEEPVPIIREEGEIAYFVGDTHGSYEESLIVINYFEKILEKSPDAKIIFDGDYVDRNLYDLENLTLITAFFLLYKNNVVMLRGNHEDQKINKYYGFYRNLKDFFIIQDRIDEIYGLILNFFMSLPVIHILTLKTSNNELKKIFTVHGGIPIDEKNPSNPIALDDLESKIQIKVPSYEEFDDYMSWLLWSDPKDNVADYELRPESGRNFFGESAFQRFMDFNKLDLMVRAHEILEQGYKFFFNQRLISIFSTSFYKNKRIGNAAIMRMKEINGSFDTPEFLPVNEAALNQDIKDNF